MKYQNLLKFVGLIFKVSALGSLIVAGILVIFPPLFVVGFRWLATAPMMTLSPEELEIAKSRHALTPEQIEILSNPATMGPKDQVSYDLIWRTASSPEIITSWLLLVLSVFLLYLIFRHLGQLVPSIRSTDIPDQVVVGRLRKTAKALVALYFVELGADLVFNRWLLQNAELLGEWKKAFPLPSAPATFDLSDKLLLYLVPTFPGATALLVALFLYFLARTIEERAELKSESSLTI